MSLGSPTALQSEHEHSVQDGSGSASSRRQLARRDHQGARLRGGGRAQSGGRRGNDSIATGNEAATPFAVHERAQNPADIFLFRDSGSRTTTKVSPRPLRASSWRIPGG